jgi:hypothetical protein
VAGRGHILVVEEHARRFGGTGTQSAGGSWWMVEEEWALSIVRSTAGGNAGRMFRKRGRDQLKPGRSDQSIRLCCPRGRCDRLRGIVARESFRRTKHRQTPLCWVHTTRRKPHTITPAGTSRDKDNITAKPFGKSSQSEPLNGLVRHAGFIQANALLLMKRRQTRGYFSTARRANCAG